MAKLQRRTHRKAEKNSGESTEKNGEGNLSFSLSSYWVASLLCFLDFHAGSFYNQSWLNEALNGDCRINTVSLCCIN